MYSLRTFYANNHYRLITLYTFELLLALFVGSRELSVGTDTLAYANRFFTMESCGCFNLKQELGFQLFTYISVLSGLGIEFYFSLLSFTLFVLVNKVVSKVATMDSRPLDLSLIYLVLGGVLVSPFFVSSHINAIRQGIASFFVFYAFLCVQNKEWTKSILLSIIAISIHLSSVMFVVLLAGVFIPLNFLFGVIAILSVLYGLGGSESLISWLSEIIHVNLYGSIKNYQHQLEYNSGVRYDFLLFSLFWVFVVFLFSTFWVKEQYQQIVELCLKIYLLLLIPFLLFGFANFSNRYVYPAWLFLGIMIPVTVYYSALWDRIKALLPYIFLCSVTIFIIMIRHGFAR
ncbi:MAG: hypothetical protein COA90_06660 [Gammaproteobacteria bacterium]|nr:MAG: hypothetical protein COA90_06660 [Gammaproteobacteria bacterium]